MLKFQVATKADLKEAAKIARQKLLEEERKPRIFHARSRKIGVDKTYLDKQVEENKRTREMEQMREDAMATAMVKNCNIAIVLEKQREEDRRRLNMEIEEFRRNHQRVEDRREFDLYDPDLLKKSLPARVGHNDPRLGLGAAQQFEGEDTKTGEGARAKREAMRWWVESQMEEREAERLAQRALKKSYDDAITQRDHRAVALARMEQNCRRRLNEATAKFNNALAEEQENRRRTEAIQDEEDKRTDILNQMNGDFLTEAKEQANSIHGPKKPLASRYKGMSDEELKFVRDEQLRQIHDIEQMRENEKRMNEEWGRMMAANAFTAQACQNELDRKKANMNKRIAEENLRLAREQKIRQDYLKREVYRNQTTPEYFEQFNKSTR